jgi:Sulfotransferase family
MTESMTDVEVVADGGRLERAAWLLPGTLIAAVRIDRPPADRTALRLLAERDGDTIVLESRWLACEEDGPERSPARWLVAASSPAAEEELARSVLVVDHGDGRAPLSSEPLETQLQEIVEFVEEGLVPLDAEVRSRVISFLHAAATVQGVTPGPELSARLVTIRNMLRDSLTVTSVSPGAGPAVRLEHVFAIDDHAYLLCGWVHDPTPQDSRITVITPEGARYEPLEGAVIWHPRPDVDEAFAGDNVRNLGFQIYVELDRASVHPAGWMIELRTAEGHELEDTARSDVTTDPDQVRRRVMRPAGASPPNSVILANHTLPAIKRLRIGGNIDIVSITSVGELPRSPDVSIVTALRGADRIEHQLVQYARDPDLRTAELVFVLPAAAAQAVVAKGPVLEQLYGVPFRVVELSGGARRPRAMNLGASVARGRLLLLMGGDVFPVEPGWLGRMCELVDSRPEIGALAPRLLHADGSIAHAGTAYVAGRDGQRWERTLPLKGLAPTIPAAQGPRRVQALTAECLLVRADSFRAVDGFSELYFDGADEAADLCFKLAEDRLESWQADVSLYWLERGSSWPVKSSDTAVHFNDWLFDRQWRTRLAEGSVDAATAAVEERPTLPQVAPGRTGAPVEILEVVPAHPDAEWLLDAGLDRPRPGVEFEPFANTYAFTVQGWAIARDGHEVTVEIREGSHLLRTTSTKRKRDEVLRRHPDAPGAGTAGFWAPIGALGLPTQFTVEVVLVSSSGERATLTTLRGRRRALRSAFSPTLNPLLITTLGRTGSSWLALLLSKHPEIVAYRPFQYEPRVASYWMEVLRSLSEPVSFLQSIKPELYEGHWWLGDERPSPLPLNFADQTMPQWLGNENVAAVAGFCQSRIDAFYSTVAQTQNQSRPRYFAEKAYPDEATPMLTRELYPDARELILVRDFRDRVCSIMGFNSKRGYKSFGRQLTDSDEEFIRSERQVAERMLETWNDRREDAFLVRYEDLIVQPEETLGAAFAYLGFDSDPATVRRTLEDANAELPNNQRAHQTSSSVAASVGRWRQDLTPEHQALCEESFGDILEAFGYELVQQNGSGVQTPSTA